MRVGGYAHLEGITFFTEAYRLTQRRGSKEPLSLTWILPPKWIRKWGKKPLLGGLPLLYYQWRAFPSGIKKMLAGLLGLYGLMGLFPSLIPLVEGLFPAEPHWLGALFLVLLVCYWKKITRMLRFHGAEHKVLNCYARYGRVDLELARRAERYHPGCGTNLAGVCLLLYGLLFLLDIDSLMLSAVLMLLAAQGLIWLVKQKNQRLHRLFRVLQRLTVWEPKEEELQLAVSAFQRLVQVHRVYQQALQGSTAALRQP